MLVVGQDNKVRRQPVELGPRSHGLRIVRKGLTGDEQIIVRGMQRVRPGIEVTTEVEDDRRRATTNGLPDNYEPVPKDQWMRAAARIARSRTRRGRWKTKSTCQISRLTNRQTCFGKIDDQRQTFSSSFVSLTFCMHHRPLLHRSPDLRRGDVDRHRDLLGGIAYLTLPASQYPDVVPPTIVVRAAYPGASPEVIADTVATPIEQEVNGVEDMLYMSSQCTNDGPMTLTITFKLGTDLDKAQVLVQNRVAIAEPRLPEDVRRLGVTTHQVVARPADGDPPDFARRRRSTSSTSATTR